MATGAAAIDRLVEVTGEKPATLQRMTRALREARSPAGQRLDLWPEGAPGGGKRSAHVEPRHLANLIMAFAGAQPSDAVEAVAALRPLKGSFSEKVQHQADEKSEIFPLAGEVNVGLPGISDLDFGELLEVFIEACRNWPVEPGMDVVLSLDPPSAQVVIRHGSGSNDRSVFYFEPAQRPLPYESAGAPQSRIRRQTTIPIEVILAACKLWADTKARRGGELPLSPSGEVPASADPENENAAPARAAPRDQNRSKSDSRTNNTGREANREREISQPLSSRGTGPSPVNEGFPDDPGPHSAHPAAT